MVLESGPFVVVVSLWSIGSVSYTIQIQPGDHKIIALVTDLTAHDNSASAVLEEVLLRKKPEWHAQNQMSVQQIHCCGLDEAKAGHCYASWTWLLSQGETDLRT